LFPGICRGSYQLQDSTLSFSNECPWDTYHSWEHILYGEYFLKVWGDSVEIYRYHNVFKDTYKLKRQL